MKKLILPAIAVLLISCKTDWNKEIVKKECVETAKKSMPNASPENLKMMENLCDCTAEKTVTKYKTKEEAEKDKKGLEDLTIECMQDYYKNNLQKKK